jgi:hypothetical protein
MRAQHPGSAARAALNDCPPSECDGAHLAALVSCNPLFDGLAEVVGYIIAQPPVHLDRKIRTTTQMPFWAQIASVAMRVTIATTMKPAHIRTTPNKPASPARRLPANTDNRRLIATIGTLSTTKPLRPDPLRDTSARTNRPPTPNAIADRIARGIGLIPTAQRAAETSSSVRPYRSARKDGSFWSVEHPQSPARRASTTARETGTPTRLVWCIALFESTNIGPSATSDLESFERASSAERPSEAVGLASRTLPPAFLYSVGPLRECRRRP